MSRAAKTQAKNEDPAVPVPIPQAAPVVAPEAKEARQRRIQDEALMLFLDLSRKVIQDQVTMAGAKAEAEEFMAKLNTPEQTVALRAVNHATGRLLSALPRFPEWFSV